MTKEERNAYFYLGILVIVGLLFGVQYCTTSNEQAEKGYVSCEPDSYLVPVTLVKVNYMCSSTNPMDSNPFYGRFYVCTAVTNVGDSITVIVRNRIILENKRPIKGYCSQGRANKYEFSAHDVPFFWIEKKKEEWGQVFKIPVTIISTFKTEDFTCNAIVPSGDTIILRIQRNVFLNTVRPFNGFITPGRSGRFFNFSLK